MIYWVVETGQAMNKLLKLDKTGLLIAQTGINCIKLVNRFLDWNKLFDMIVKMRMN